MLREMACEGRVVHRRSWPLAHSFGYPVWMVCRDVDRLDVPLGSRLWSHRWRLAPLSLRSGDFPRPARSAQTGSIRQRLNTLLAAHGIAPAERVFLLTQPRSWGWLFNPVSFYFCYRGGALATVVAEITNTPWGEVHHYPLIVETAEAGGDGQEQELVFRFPKAFHVSPFMPMDMDYLWRVRLTGGTIEIAMRLLRGGREAFFAGLYLHGRPLSAAAVRRGALAYPLQSVRTLARIYGQALALWWRRAPFFTHPAKAGQASST